MSALGKAKRISAHLRKQSLRTKVSDAFYEGYSSVNDGSKVVIVFCPSGAKGAVSDLFKKRHKSEDFVGYIIVEEDESVSVHSDDPALALLL